jgi:DNA-binding NarL/FixJ family response regulator
LALKIVLVDDQPVPGLTLRRWLKKQRDLEVVGEAVPGSPVLALIPLVEPDVVLLDVLTSPEAGLNVARMIREHFPTVPIVAIGEATAGNLRVEAAEAGAWAFFPKTSPEELAKAIPSVIQRGGRRFSDLSNRTTHRPAPDSFVALPEEKPRRKTPVPLETAPAAPAAVASAAPQAGTPATPPVPTAAPQPVPTAAPQGAPKWAPQVAPRSRTPKASPAPAAAGSTAAPAKASPAPAPKKSPASAARQPAKRVLPPALPETTPPARKSQASRITQSNFELVPTPRTAGPRDALARTHSALEPVFEQVPVQRPRRRRGKKGETSEEIDVRGPTGLPRRFGGHR